MRKNLIAVALALLIGGCAKNSPPLTTVTLLPDTDGGVGHITVTRGKYHEELTKAYDSVRLGSAGGLVRQRTDLASLQDRYGEIFRNMPEEPTSFTVYFEFDSDQLTTDSLKRIREVRAVLGKRAAPALRIVGHTDTMGSSEANDRLGLRRARLVANLMVKSGFTKVPIELVSRGERETLVATGDNVANSINRRVELVVR